MWINGKNFGHHVIYLAHHPLLDIEAWYQVYRGKIVDCAPGKIDLMGENWSVVKSKIENFGFVVVKIIGGKEQK